MEEFVTWFLWGVIAIVVLFLGFAFSPVLFGITSSLGVTTGVTGLMQNLGVAVFMLCVFYGAFVLWRPRI